MELRLTFKVTPIPRQEESPVFMKGTPPPTSFPDHASKLIENQELLGSFLDTWPRLVTVLLLRSGLSCLRAQHARKCSSQGYKPAEDGDCYISSSPKALDTQGELLLPSGQPLRLSL